MIATTAFVDSHVHFWNRNLFNYNWLAEAGGQFPETYLPEHLLADGPRAQALVFVEAAADPRQGVTEAEWAARHVRAWGGEGAVVAFAPLEDARLLPEHLERLAETPEVRGVRRLLQDEPLELFEEPALASGLRRIAAAGLVFDACIRAHQMRHFLGLRRAAPEVEIVLDHLGKPPVRAGWGSPQADDWYRNLILISSEPNTTAKLSGLAPESDPNCPTIPQARPFLEAAIEAFGPSRCMVGSDFPVSKGEPAGVDYGAWVEAVGALVAEGGERDALLHATASRVYGFTAGSSRT